MKPRQLIALQSGQHLLFVQHFAARPEHLICHIHKSNAQWHTPSKAGVDAIDLQPARAFLLWYYAGVSCVMHTSKKPALHRTHRSAQSAP